MKSQHKILFGGLLGNLSEAYDMALCFFLASQLNATLLGPHAKTTFWYMLLVSISYLTKPIGAMLFGLISDTRGRKHALVLSILTMGIGTLGIALIPGYENIGLISGLLFLLLKIVQNLSLGAEFLNSVSYLVESGDPKSMGFRGSWASTGVKAGTLLAAWVVSLQETMHFSWRIPFLLSVITLTIGYFIRFSLPESLAYVRYYANHSKPSYSNLMQSTWGIIKTFPFATLYAFCGSFFAIASGVFYFLYLPMMIKIYALIDKSLIDSIMIHGLLIVTLTIPVFGYLTDKLSRPALLIFSALSLSIITPIMLQTLYAKNGLFEYLYYLTALMSALFYATNSVYLTTLFPTHIRCTALSLIFAIAGGIGAAIVPVLSPILLNQHLPVLINAVILDLPILTLLGSLIFLTKITYKSHLLSNERKNVCNV